MKKFWSYNNYFAPPIAAQFQLTLGEGLPAGASAQAGSTPVYTPVVNWSTLSETGQPVDNFSGATLQAKKEFVNPTGTHKDRSFAYWISYLYERGAKELTIASSGNSAISAAAYCKKAGIQLHAFISAHLAQEKKERLQTYGSAIVHEELLPRKAAIQFSLARNIPNLLASKHDEGTEGYKTIAFEMTEQAPEVTHIFVPTSSGATIRGMYRGFEMLRKERGILMPRLYAVQTTKVHPIAEKFDQAFTPETQSHAQAIVDRVSPRHNEIIEILQKTKGGGFVISQKELEEARGMLEDKNLGWQSVLALAGFVKFARLHFAQGAKRDTLRPAQNVGGRAKQKAQQDAELLEKVRALCLFTD